MPRSEMTYSLPPRMPPQVLWLLQLLSPLRALPPLPVLWPPQELPLL